MDAAKDFIQKTRGKLYDMFLALDAPEQFKALADKVVLDEKAVTAVMAVTETKVADDVIKGETLWQTQKAILMKFIETYQPPKAPMIDEGVLKDGGK